jgi:hypothetical protein
MKPVFQSMKNRIAGLKNRVRRAKIGRVFSNLASLSAHTEVSGITAERLLVSLAPAHFRMSRANTIFRPESQ